MTLAAINIGSSLQQGLDAFFAFLPNLLAFLVILVVGFIVAKAVSAIVRKVGQKAGLDKALHKSDAKQYVDRVSPDASPSAAIGKVFFWLIFVFVLTAAIGALKIPAVTAFMNQVLAYLPNVIAAIVIFVVAAAIAGAVATGVAKLLGDTPTGKVVATAVPALVMLIAVFMILNQLKIAPEIVTITYAALLGSVALGAALAFGLGGREVAGKMLGDAYDKGQEQKGQVKDDLQTGRDRGQEQAERGKQRAQAEVGDTGGGNGGGDQQTAIHGTGVSSPSPSGSYRAEG